MKAHPLARGGMGEGEGFGVQRLALQADFFGQGRIQGARSFGVAIDLIADQRHTNICHVDADLMCTTGLEHSHHFRRRRPGIALQADAKALDDLIIGGGILAR